MLCDSRVIVWALSGSPYYAAESRLFFKRHAPERFGSVYDAIVIGVAEV